jgi:hypothetical protein
MAKTKNKTSTDTNERIAQRLIELITEDLNEGIDSIISNAATRNSARFTIMAKVNDLDGTPECFIDIKWAKRFNIKSESVLDDPNQDELFKGGNDGEAA